MTESFIQTPVPIVPLRGGVVGRSAEMRDVVGPLADVRLERQADRRQQKRTGQ